MDLDVFILGHKHLQSFRHNNEYIQLFKEALQIHDGAGYTTDPKEQPRTSSSKNQKQEQQRVPMSSYKDMMIDAATTRLFEVALDRARRCGLID